jgi:phosphohistidine phosphatase
MNLYVMRHTDAVPVGGVVTRDAERVLSVRGGEDAVLMGRVLARLDPFIDIVVTSPLVRAIQTGEAVGTGVSDHPIFHVSNNLLPGFNEKNLLEEIIAISGGGNVIAIGHQPDLTRFISFLVSGGVPSGIAMDTGAIAHVRLQMDPTRREASLRWLMTPATVKSLHPNL